MNTNLIIQVMKDITDENLNMNVWGRSPLPKMTCGTQMCFAGHTVVAAGHALEWVREWHGDYEATYTTDGYGVEDLAAELLGLDDDQVAQLFFETDATTVDELWEAVTRITGVKRPSLVPA